MSGCDASVFEGFRRGSSDPAPNSASRTAVVTHARTWNELEAAVVLIVFGELMGPAPETEHIDSTGATVPFAPCVYAKNDT